MKKIVIFASGSGSNAENIIKYFEGNRKIRVVALFCNRPDAFALERARRLGVPGIVFDREELTSADGVSARLRVLGADLIVLAGFLWRMPAIILEEYPGRVINIHPALLPAHGGKGMYGERVHEAVIRAGDKKSGITIHHVNEQYDEGAIIFQTSCDVEPGETPGSLATKIHALEHAHFPAVIRVLLERQHGTTRNNTPYNKYTT
ncbi:MAG: phosphoribosylglycinamide formyltransferase [Odoribacteraceae bacterium]|jgi:phosphoribosylglycinamide formyltransferase-1|nr:phosphoribosylglycinamide formyltransferase [Odoribacteraceae bacterium]